MELENKEKLESHRFIPRVLLPGETALLGVGNCGNGVIKEELLKLTR